MLTRVLNVALRLALLAALFASMALYVDYQPNSVGAICAAGGGCGAVRASNFSHIAGVPVPVIGVGVFGGLLVMAVWASRRWHIRVLALACVLAGLGAMVFIGLQVFVIGAICPWCMGVDSSALVAAIVAAVLVTRQPDNEPGWLRSLWTAGGVLALILPLLWPISATNAPPIVRAEQLPARVNIVSFTDFQCPYCRRLHKVMVDVEKQHGDKLNVVLLMRPLRRHKRAKSAALAYLCMPKDKQPAYAHQLYSMKQKNMTPEHLRTLALAAGVEGKVFDSCLADPAHAARIEQLRLAFKAAGLKGIPATFVEDHFVKGASEKQLRQAVSRALAGNRGGSNLGWMIALIMSSLGAIAALSLWQRHTAGPDLARQR